MKRYFFISIIVLSTVLFIKNSFSADPPHATTSAPAVSCNNCHTLHKAPGGSLTSRNTNENLCISCHTSGGPATNKPMVVSEQAATTGRGRHHRWDVSIETGVAPLSLAAGTAGAANPYGLRPASEIANTDLKIMLQKFGNYVVCSVCHNQHSQARAAWDPLSAGAYTSGTTTGRHMQRMENELNQMCEDCHYYRAMTYSRARGDDAAYPANGTNVFSHPVGVNLNSLGYDKTAPLDYNGSPHQTAPRYYNNGTGETNSTNNISLDATSKVRCMSCHRVHYSDSSGATVDAP